MGSTYGLKLKNIRNNHILKDLIINGNEKIVEYVYYITRINKYFIENYKKSTLIKEITLFNIFNKKEYNIGIELVESGYFFDGLEYVCEEVQKIGCYLLVTNIVEDSYAFGKINAYESILLGDSDKYYTCFKDVEYAINKKKARFIFYDVCEGNIVEIDFEENRGDNFSLGIECIEINERYANQLIDNKRKVKENKNVLFEIEDKDQEENNNQAMHETIEITDNTTVDNSIPIIIEETKITPYDDNTEPNIQIVDIPSIEIDSTIPDIMPILIKKYYLSNKNTSPIDYTYLSISQLDKNTKILN
jgi:hypothetical protein